MIGELIELAGTVVEGVGQSSDVANSIHRRFGCAGCIVILVVVAGVVGMLAWAIIRAG